MGENTEKSTSWRLERDGPALVPTDLQRLRHQIDVSAMSESLLNLRLVTMSWAIQATYSYGWAAGVPLESSWPQEDSQIGRPPFRSRVTQIWRKESQSHTISGLVLSLAST